MKGPYSGFQHGSRREVLVSAPTSPLAILVGVVLETSIK